MTEVGTTGEMMFIYHLTGFWNPPEMCFVVTANINGETSEWSNMACVQTEPQECFDLSGIDFGDCEMVLGIGWNGYECILISGCGWIVDGVDYSPYFFETMDECTAECGGPPSETAVLYGTVNYLWGDAVELIAGAQIVAMNEMGMIYETFSDDYGGYELQMIAGTYEVSCSLPDSGETQSQTVTIEAGDMQVLDFWFGEPVEQYALFGMVYGETASGEAVPMDGAQIVVYYSGTVLETYSTEGAYWISLPEPGEYQVAVNAEGYIGIEEVINISGLTEMDFFLQPLDIGMLVVHLNVGSATAMPGDTVAIPIFMETEHPVGGIQFTLTDVPDHVTAIGYLSHMECFSASFNDVDGSAITIFFSPGGCT
ncbi:MAG: carboxypeptidase-like regulatory domain-containing protein, partial [Fidelibacterota bacterium]